MKAKQIDVEIDFYKDDYDIIAEAIPISCKLKEDFPEGFLGHCDRRHHWKNEMIDGCAYCKGINIWTNQCLCIYNREHNKTIKKI